MGLHRSMVLGLRCDVTLLLQSHFPSTLPNNDNLTVQIANLIQLGFALPNNDDLTVQIANFIKLEFALNLPYQFLCGLVQPRLDGVILSPWHLLAMLYYCNVSKALNPPSSLS